MIATVIVCACRANTAPLTELQRVTSGSLDVVLLSARDALHQGKDTFVIEFRSAPGGTLVDVGNVRASATMPMPGMPMFATIDIQRSAVPGRYAATADFSMAGSWRTTIEWDSPSGKASFILPLR